MSRNEMRKPSFLVLAALAAGRQHGYGLLRNIRMALGDGEGVQAGTLYAALDRLTEEGLVHVTGEETVDGRPRRYFEITEEGASALEAETTRLNQRVHLAEQGLAARSRTFGTTHVAGATGATA